MNVKKRVWIRLDEVDSTNDYAKARRGERENLVVCAKTQSAGRGTKGRSFSSKEGGVYCSLLTFYEDFPAKAGFTIMAGAAVAACKTLTAYGLTPSIKWPNDIHVGGKKIAGILIENTLQNANISSSVVGVGLNVYGELPAELSELATTMEKESGMRFSVDEVLNKLVEYLDSPHAMEEYEGYLGYTGRRVTLIIGNECVPATLLGVTKEGELQAEIDGEGRTFSSAEVTLRI